MPQPPLGDFVDACKSGALGRVRALLAEHPDLATSTYDGYPVIDWTCEAGNIEVGLALLDAGAPADAFTCAALGLADPLTAHLDADPALLEAPRPLFAYRLLHCAAENGHADIVRDLLARGADPDAPNDWGATPVFFAVIAARHHPATEGHLACCRLLLEDGGGRPIANVRPQDPLSTFARNAIGYAPDADKKALAERILAYVLEREAASA